jgi:hypothetical protein
MRISDLNNKMENVIKKNRFIFEKIFKNLANICENCSRKQN